MGKKIKGRDNDITLQKVFEKNQIKFEQTHLMNAPNVQASYSAVHRFQQPVPPAYNRNIFRLAWDWVSHLIHPTWKNSRVQTREQIFEKSDIEFKQKSAGLPWSMAGIPFKQELYDDPEFLLWDQQMWDEKFQRCPCLAHVTVKKEILPQKKVHTNRLRNVMAVDGSHALWMQRLCYDAHHKMQKHPIENLTALGWSPYRMGMQHLAEHLGKHPNGWEIDGGAWESHMFEACLEEIAKLKFEALVREEQTHANWVRIRNIYHMISRLPIVLPDGFAFLKGWKESGGNLTGQVGTAHDNTLLMLFAVCYAWIALVDADFHHMLHETSIITFGDDLTFTVSDDVVEQFNGEAIAKLLWDDLGFVLESPCWTARPFHELGFLSMHFVFSHEHRKWVHKIDRDKLYSNILQGGKERTPEEQLQRLCGMRNVAWGEEQMRAELQAVIEDYIIIYDDTLKGDPLWEQAKKSYLPDRLIDKLYFGFESAQLLAGY
jgi:hypothetical protein